MDDLKQFLFSALVAIIVFGALLYFDPLGPGLNYG